MCLSCGCWPWGSGVARLLKCVLQLHLSFEPVTCWGQSLQRSGPIATPTSAWLAAKSSLPLILPPSPLHPCSLLNTHKTLVLHLRDCFLLFLFPKTAFAVCGRGSYFVVICVLLHTSHKQWQGVLYAHKAEHYAAISWEGRVIQSHCCVVWICGPMI